MGDFAKLDLSQYRQEIESGAEVDHNGNRINKCAKGSVGRFIKDWQKQKFKNQNENEPNHRLSFPKARTILSIEHYGNLHENVWEKENRLYRRMDNRPNSRINDKIDPSESLKMSVEDPTRLKTSRNSTDYGKYNTEYENFVEQIQNNLINKMKYMPLFVSRAMYIFTDKENIYYITKMAESEDIISKEIGKSNSKYIDIFVNCFYDIAEKTVKKYHRLLKMARELGNMNPDDMKISNRHNLPLPIVPIKAGERNLDPKDEKELETTIIIEAIDYCISILKKRKNNIEMTQYELQTKYLYPKPIGGTFIVNNIRENENKSKNYRVCAKMLKNGENPLSLWDYDPEAYEMYKRMNPQNSFSYLLPKRQRDRLNKRLGKCVEQQHEIY